ncbi:ATP-binding cassette domain-containing protein [Reinekea sp.]|jgi:phosphonate transport system ATP-binding protein|uniref:ATP-binding cassette domain-containing protein n=1 Tax=Reinekea sp. TaxID=1970455 RepID=UPI002A7F3A82|nr:ATP-binding cassette domain-containing protein [Reinekea sp.]
MGLSARNRGSIKVASNGSNQGLNKSRASAPEAAANPPLFHLDQATLAYGQQTALASVSLSIRAGEKVALVGPSGAGKTSLLNVLYQQQREQIAWCPQHYGLVDILSVYHNIYMGQLERHSAVYNIWNLLLPIARHQQAIGQLASELGLEHKLHHSIDQLSGGQQQRVSIGRALYRNKATFLGDEPVASLDPIQGEAILAKLIERHPTVVIALHNRHMALSVFDRIIGIKGGRVVLDRPVNAISHAELDQLYAQ